VNLNIAQALTYVFDDREWATKLGISAVIALVSFLLTPVLLGLVGWAILLGYQVALVRNIRAGMTHPLPTWENIDGYLSAGGNAMIAFVIYNLPNIIIGIVLGFGFGVSGDAPFTGGVVLTAITCCLLPLLFVYNAIVYPMFALGMGRYVDEPQTATFFDISNLFGLLRLHTDKAIKWLVATILVGLLIAIVALIPCLGQIAALALVTPVFGHLVGQFATQVMGKPIKRKPEPRPGPRAR
jgi:hypothetical protein